MVSGLGISEDFYLIFYFAFEFLLLQEQTPDYLLETEPYQAYLNLCIMKLQLSMHI